MNSFELNLFPSLYDTQFDRYVFETAEELVNAFQKNGVETLKKKEKGELFILGHLKDKNKGRKKDDLDSTNVIVLDIDKTNDAESKEAFAYLKPYCFIAYETYRSSKDNPRYRIIVPLDKPVSGQKFQEKKLASALADILGIKNIDDASNNPVQTYFFPSTPPGQTRELICNKTEQCFPLDKLLNHKIKTTKSSAHSKKDKDQSEVSEIDTKIAQDLLKNEFNNELMHVNYQFFFYVDGWWDIVKRDELLQHIAVSVFGKPIPVPDAQKITRALDLVAYQPSFPEFGKERIILRNCAIDPITRTQYKHSSKHYARNRLDFDFDPQAQCPLWLQFLHEIFANDKDQRDKIKLLQEYTGLSLTRDNSFQKSLWLLGSGANGKSVVIAVVQALLGEGNYSTVPVSSFSGRFALCDMENKLANFDPDLSISAKLADDKIKPIVSGDAITIERKFEPTYKTRMVVKLWVAANDLPATQDTSHGLFRRIMILTFNRIFAEHEQDHALTEKLTTELPGIFNWALDGLQRLLKNGMFTMPKSSKEAMAEYQTSSDPVRQFKAEHLVDIDISHRLKDGMLMKDIYSAFKVYCDANGIRPIPASTKLGAQLKVLGINKRASGDKRYYPVKLKDMDQYYKYQMVNIEDVNN